MATLGERALKIAIQEIGVREQPDGSNTGPRVREYQAATWLPGTGWPWCAAFCGWAYRHAGYVFPDRSAGAWDLVDRAVRNGWAVTVTAAGARPGDLVAFRVGSGHVALLERYDPSTATVHTVDGNVSNMVARRGRPVSQVYRIVRVKADPGVPVPPARRPAWEIVRGEGDRARVVFTSPSLDATVGRAARLLSRGANGLRIRRARPPAQKGR